MYARQLSYTSGVMVCMSNINGVPLGEKLSNLTVSDLQRASDRKKYLATANRKVAEGYLYIMWSNGAYNRGNSICKKVLFFSFRPLWT